MIASMAMRVRASLAAEMLQRLNGAKDYDRAALAVAHAILTDDANEAHAAYPQYKDHWDGWGLCRLSARIKTKAGIAFERGDLALYKVERRDTPGEPPIVVTLYSNRNGVDTQIGASTVAVNRKMGVLLLPTRRDRDQGCYPNG